VKDFGITHSVGDFVEGCNGTILFAVTQGMPFPGVTLVLPRSPAFDELVTVLLGKIQLQPPAEGSAMSLPIPNMPLPVQLACDAQHWLITSDVMLGSQWPAGQPGGWADSAAGKAALAKAGDQAFAIGSSDTPTIIRTIIPLLQMAGIGNGDMEPNERQALMMALNKLAMLASTGWLVVRPAGEGVVMEDQGLMGISAIMGGAVLAGMSRSAVTQRSGQDEANAAQTLKSTIFPAQIQFQSGVYMDQDGDGVGEFGLLDELSGERPTGRAAAGTIKLVPAELEEDTQAYCYFVYLPSADGSTVEAPEEKTEARAANAAAAKAQARRFVAYAWPADETAGGKQFAITQAGIVYVSPYTGGVPTWNALFDNGTWETEPTWPQWKAASGATKPVPRKNTPKNQVEPAMPISPVP